MTYLNKEVDHVLFAAEAKKIAWRHKRELRTISSEMIRKLFVYAIVKGSPDLGDAIRALNVE